MFKTRLISAVFIVIFTLLFVITGGPFLYVVSLALSLIGMMEFLRMVNIHKTLLAVIGYGAVTALYLMIYTGDLLKKQCPELDVKYFECGEVYTYTDSKQD